MRWQALQTATFCSTACAWAALTPAKPASRNSALRAMIFNINFCDIAYLASRRMDRLVTMSLGEYVIFISALIIQLRIAAQCDTDILLSIKHISSFLRGTPPTLLVTS